METTVYSVVSWSDSGENTKQTRQQTNIFEHVVHVHIIFCDDFFHFPEVLDCMSVKRTIST